MSIDVDPTHSTLRRLHLDNNRLEDEGARRLAHSLRRNSTLRIVSLHGNHHIGSRGAAALHAASRSRQVRALSAVDYIACCVSVSSGARAECR